jgi:hypothetical protein
MEKMTRTEGRELLSSFDTSKKKKKEEREKHHTFFLLSSVVCNKRGYNSETLSILDSHDSFGYKSVYSLVCYNLLRSNL